MAWWCVAAAGVGAYVRTWSKKPAMGGVPGPGTAAQMATKAISTTRESPRELVSLVSTEVSPPGSPNVVCHFSAAPCVSPRAQRCQVADVPRWTPVAAVGMHRKVRVSSAPCVPTRDPREAVGVAQHPKTP